MDTGGAQNTRYFLYLVNICNLGNLYTLETVSNNYVCRIYFIICGSSPLIQEIFYSLPRPIENQMTFYESIFLWQFSMRLLGLLTTKHFFSFILGCPQDFNFAWPFCPFGPVSTQPYQNGRTKLKSCGHPRIKLKRCFVVGRPKSFIENCRKKINS